MVKSNPYAFRITFPVVVDGKCDTYMTEAMAWPEICCLRRHLPDLAEVLIVSDVRSYRRRQATTEPVAVPLTFGCGSTTRFKMWRLPVVYVGRDPALDVHGKRLRKRRRSAWRALRETLVDGFPLFVLLALGGWLALRK